MDAYGGFIFICNGEEETGTLRRYIGNYRSCSVPMNNAELQLGIVELCLFSFDHQFIQYVALMRRAKEIASENIASNF